MSDPLPSTAEALDALYRTQEDPWGTRTIVEKRVRYGELDRLLPREPVRTAVDLACGEGDFASRLCRLADRVTGVDLSETVIARAAQRFPRVAFRAPDVRDLSSDWFAQFELICWVDAVYWLTRPESARVFERIAEGARGRPLTLLVSSRIVPGWRSGWYWPGHDFETARAFLEHVRLVFPEARGVPVQLHLNLRPAESLTPLQRVVRIAFKVLTKLGGYRPALRLAQRASAIPFLSPMVEPFVAHVAAVVEPGRRPYPEAVEDVTDRTLNRPLAGRLVRWLMPTGVTPNQVTGASCLLGVAAAGSLALGSWPALALGAVLLQLSIVLDCADGQLARAKGRVSQWGEVLDHASDDLSFVLVSIALASIVWQSELAVLLKLLLLIGGVASALLLTASQYFYEDEYRGVASRGVTGGVPEASERVKRSSARAPQGWLDRLKRGLSRYYAVRQGVMHRGLLRLNPWRAGLLGLPPVRVRGRRCYWELQALPLALWRLAGISSVALALGLGCLLGAPVAFAWGLTLAGLPYFGLALALQRRADRLTLRAWSETGGGERQC